MSSFKYIFILPSLWLLLCGCPSPNMVPNDMKQFSKDHYDFKKLVQKNYKGIYFDCPKAFVKSYFSNFMYKKGGLSLGNLPMGIHLSVEKFDESEAEKFAFYYEDSSLTNLLAVHEYYMDARRASLQYYENSIKTVLPEGSKLPGAMEVIYGRQGKYDEDLNYMVATVEKDNSWYVFQFITGKELASYTFDDFEEMIKSAR